MHPFPPEPDLAWLIGDQFDTLLFGPFTLHFGFESGGRITVEYPIEHTRPDGQTSSYDPQTRTGEARLQLLFLQKIVSLQRQELTLTLTFEHGDRLILSSELGPYECGTIEDPNKRLDVF